MKPLVTLLSVFIIIIPIRIIYMTIHLQCISYCGDTTFNDLIWMHCLDHNVVFFTCLIVVHTHLIAARHISLLSHLSAQFCWIQHLALVWHNGECVASPPLEGVDHSWGRWWGTTCALCVQAAAVRQARDRLDTTRASRIPRAVRKYQLIPSWTGWRLRGRRVDNFQAKQFLTCTLINVSTWTFIPSLASYHLYTVKPLDGVTSMMTAQGDTCNRRSFGAL